MATGLGYKAKASWNNSGYAAAWGIISANGFGKYNKIPYVSESISDAYGWLKDDVLDGSQGRASMVNVSILPNGNLELQGSYLGMGNIIACAMGYERVRSLTILESPDITTPVLTGRTATGGTSGTLVDSGASWTTNQFAGMYVRNEEFWASDNSANCWVGRIASNNGTTLTLADSWGAPHNGDSYSIGYSFLHKYEMSKNLHQETFASIITSEDSFLNTGYCTRVGCLLIDKGVQVWEWERCMVESIAFKMTADGLKVTAEIVPYLRDITPDLTDSSGCMFHALENTAYAGGLVLRPNRILRGDATFRIDDYSASTELTNADDLGISEFELKIKNNLQSDLQTTATGKYRAEPVRSAKREVTGSFTVPRYTATTLQGKLAAGTTLMATLSCLGPVIGAGSEQEEFNIYMRALKLEKGDSPVAGPQPLEEKYTFTCLAPAGDSDGMPTESEGTDNSEVIITMRNANPYNAFMDQGAE
jgi:hypothetical protein